MKIFKRRNNYIVRETSTEGTCHQEACVKKKTTGSSLGRKKSILVGNAKISESEEQEMNEYYLYKSSSSLGGYKIYRCKTNMFENKDERQYNCS